MEHLMVAGLALFDIWAAFAPAIILKTNPLYSALIIGFSSSIGVLATVYFCSLFREWTITKLNKQSFVGARTQRFMTKYGTPGLGLLSPLVLGPVLTCAGAIALGAQSRQLAAWAVLGVWLWAAAFYAVLALGFGTQLARMG